MKFFIQALLGGGLFAASCVAPPTASPVHAANEATAQAVSNEEAGAASLDFANGLYARRMYAAAAAEYERYLRDHSDAPEAASARFRLADSFYFTGDYANAAERFAEFLKDFPDEKRVPLTRFRLGASYYHLGRHGDAARIFYQLIPASPERNLRSGAIFYLAKCYEARLNPEKGRKLLEEILSTYPETEYVGFAALALGDHWVKSGERAKALEVYGIAAEMEEPAAVAAEAKLRTGEITFDLGNLVRAEQAFASVMETPTGHGPNPDLEALRERALAGLFSIDLKREALDAALVRWEKERAFISGKAVELQALLVLAELHEMKGNQEAARSEWDKVIAHPQASSKDKVRALFRKSQSLLAGKKFEEALGAAEAAIPLDEESAPRAEYQKAVVLRAAARTPEALKSYSRVIEKFQGSEWARAALYERAALRLESGDSEGARKDFRVYAARYPRSEEAETAALEVVQIEMESGRIEKAVKSAERFIRKYPESRWIDAARYKLAVAYTALGRFDKAAEFFGGVSEEAPLHAEALYGLAVSLEKLGRKTDAVSAYERFVRSYADHALAGDSLSRLFHLYLGLNDAAKAADAFRKIFFEMTEIPVDSGSAFWFLQVLLARRDYAEMLKAADALTRRLPAKEGDLRHEAAFYRGEALMGLSNYAAATEAYSSAVQTKPDGVFVPHATLGMGIASLMTGDRKTAEKHLNDALRFDQELKVTMRARFEIAGIRLRERNLAEAARAYMLVAILYDDPKYTPLSLYKAAECFAKVGRAAEAEEAANELKKRYPESSWAKKIRLPETSNA